VGINTDEVSDAKNIKLLHNEPTGATEGTGINRKCIGCERDKPSSQWANDCN